MLTNVKQQTALFYLLYNASLKDSHIHLIRFYNGQIQIISLLPSYKAMDLRGQFETIIISI